MIYLWLSLELFIKVTWGNSGILRKKQFLRPKIIIICFFLWCHMIEKCLSYLNWKTWTWIAPYIFKEIFKILLKTAQKCPPGKFGGGVNLVNRIAPNSSNFLNNHRNSEIFFLNFLGKSGHMPKFPPTI